jgi:hypothetical protein
MVISVAEDQIINEQLRDTFIARQISRTNKNVFLVNLLLILGVCGYGAAKWRYLINFMSVATSMSADQLASVKDPKFLNKYFISVRGQESFESGLQFVEQEVNESTQAVTSRTVKADYVVLFMDGRFLIVKASPGAATQKQFEGALVTLPTDVRSRIVSEIKDRPDLVQAVLPVMLDATGFRYEGYWTLAICIPILLFGGWNLRRVHLRRKSPGTHPILRNLSGYGAIPQLALDIDTDLRGPTEKLGDATVTTSWILSPRLFELRLCRITDVVWAYQKVTKHSVNLIPTGKTYAAIVFGRDGVPMEISGGQEKIEKLLQILSSRVPWAVIGFTNDLDKAIRANWWSFVAEIDQQRGAKSVAASSASGD